jgi:hypothetical protein
VGDLQIDAGSVLTYEDARHSVDLTYVQYGFQLVAARWFFVQSGSDLLLDDEVLLSPDPDVDFVTVIGAAVAGEEGATLEFVGATSLPATDAVIVHVANDSGTDRAFLMVMLPEGTTLTEDGALPEDLTTIEGMMGAGATPVGFVPVAAGGAADMALLGLPPGVYALVDLTDGTALPLTIIEPAA